MIEIKNVSKKFGDIVALKSLDAQIEEGNIFGLVGTNGAGKSTLLRIIAGIYKPDMGQVTINNNFIFETLPIKQEIFYVSDDQYTFANSTMSDMKNYYKTIYKNFSEQVFLDLTKSFKLDPNRNCSTFSKGMQKQSHIICALASGARYLLLDETFDGLDPVMRQAVKKLLASQVAQGKITPIIASHNLRELEDICDRVGLLHKGGIVLDIDVQNIDAGVHKVQCGFENEPDRNWFEDLELLSFEKRSRLCTIVTSSKTEKMMEIINSHKPQFVEIIPLSLEELFIAKMEGEGYEIENILL